MPRKRSRRKRPPTGTLFRRWSAVAAVVIVAYLYYHPLRTYFSTKHELGTARTQVSQLAAQHRGLREQLSAASSTNSLAREARELGYVRPGEQLFIVQGIEAWLRAHNTGAHGR
jgi:cell division protein FtsB